MVQFEGFVKLGIVWVDWRSLSMIETDSSYAVVQMFWLIMLKIGYQNSKVYSCLC